MMTYARYSLDPLENCCTRSEEHTSELQSHSDLVCRLLLEKKKNHSFLRLGYVSAVYRVGDSGDQARFFRREVRVEAGVLRDVSHSSQRDERFSELLSRASL